MESDNVLEEPKKILCVGLVCVDLIQIVESFPKEDSDQRCIEQRWQRGGNASNNCTVLSQLGVPCEFFGTVSKGVFADYVENDFQELNISCENCIVHEGRDFPLSSVIINKVNGSRTIIHSNRNLPELTAEDFYKLDLSKYSWIHFEGRRNTAAIAGMMRRVIHFNEEERPDHQSKVKLSVELEKANRTQLLDLIPLCDVGFVGKDFATSQAYNTMSDTVRHLKPNISDGCELVVAWGERGSMGVSKEGKIVQSIAYTPTEIVDTLGAGDTFVAGTISLLVKGHSLQDGITFGCKLAGAKIGIEGLKNLKCLFEKIRHTV
uniref:Ketohexokinase n=2 Tax=Cacopsylla melanoneura TaxID=428564 RepID=A0A8D8ULA6_9HEMI